LKLIILLVFVSVMGIMSSPVSASDKTVIGAAEDIVIMPVGVRLAARVDTGAYSSSLDVCDFKVEGKYVTFALSDRCGGHKMRRPLIKMKTVRTSEGSDKRPVIILDICVGSKLIKTRFTLNDRSKMDYPVLLGRKALAGKFVVDVSRTNLLPPACPGIKLTPAGKSHNP
jgi:hypothetical protein